MSMNLEQSQRKDIDTSLYDRISLIIDENNNMESPYEFSPSEYKGINWIKQNNSFIKYNLVEQDSIIFLSSHINDLLQKNITNIIVSFDYNISNNNYNPILDNISFTIMDITNHFSVENDLNSQGHIDINCSLFNFNSDIINTAIVEEGFELGINFNGLKSNATIELYNVLIKFEFKNKLQNEINSVINRANVNGKLISEITSDTSGDITIYTIHFNDDTQYSFTTGSGTGSIDIVTNWNSTLSDAKVPSEKLTKTSLDNKISKSLDVGLVKNDGSIDSTQYLSSLPSHTHDDRYYTESEMDTALSNKQATLVSGSNIKTVNNQSILGSGNITIQGGSGSVIGTGSFSINENGHLIVELPNGIDNPYYINNNGHLIYDTSNTHNNGV